jgi:hypothetical protein
MLGQFLEFSVQPQNILESLGFYKALGFTELEVGDLWPHKYTVVSDGELCGVKATSSCRWLYQATP